MALQRKRHFQKALTYVLGIALVALVCLFLYLSSSSKVHTQIDTHIYLLPFASIQSFKVVQGYGGRFSHNRKAALDFEMPVGTSVHAARGGMVYAYKDDSNKGGPWPSYNSKANYIIIQHSDGSFGCYWHLKKGGVRKKSGAVKAGELIGYSGATGFVLQPHLHFAVKSRLSYDEDAFLKTKFATTKGTEFLEAGSEYMRP